MSTTSRPARRRATAVAAAVLLLSAMAVPALAVPAMADAPTADPTPRVTVAVSGDQVTLTTDLASAQAACARVDTVRTRLTGLIARIEGDAGTTGSVEWLRARSNRAADQGHDDQARRLTDRADRRAAHLDELEAALNRLDAADANVCAALPAAK